MLCAVLRRKLISSPDMRSTNRGEYSAAAADGAAYDQGIPLGSPSNVEFGIQTLCKSVEEIF